MSNAKNQMPKEAQISNDQRAVPLKANADDAVLDLQEVFDQAHAYARHSERRDYSSPPFPPLSPEDNGWADQILKACGFRT
jgi:hypothetical protein